MRCKTGITLIVALAALLLGAPGAFAIYSYSDVVATLQELSAVPHDPGAPHLRIVRIGTTVKGRAILMAVLEAPGAEEPADAYDVERAPEEALPEEPPTAGALPDVSTPDEPLTLTLEPVAAAGSTPEPADAGAEGDTEETAGGGARAEMLPLLPEVPQDALAPEEGGRPRVLIICRQHGNEPAPTEAAMRFLKEFAAADDPVKQSLLQRVTLAVIPMLNVDGAEKYQRRNARNVDLNRDWAHQTQPETQAVVRTARDWQPDLIVDAHELHPTDWTPSFVEAMEKQAGAPGEIGEACNAAIAAVVGPLRERSLPIYARPVFNYREPRLAHRYFAVRRGIPTILIETRRAGGAAVERRTEFHYQAFQAVTRYMAGEELATPPRVVAAWLEPGSSKSEYQRVRSDSEADRLSLALAARRQMQLASRGGNAAAVAKKRAEAARKAAAAAKKRK